MRKELRLQEPNNGKHVLAYVVDLLIVVTSTIALYFIFLYGFFNPVYKYNDYKTNKEAYLTKYSLNADSNKDYKFYEEKVQDFFFVHFKNEIVESYKKGGLDYSIEHIYNFSVLNLPIEPTININENTMFVYQAKPDGSFDVDKVALTKVGSGKTYEKNLKDIFYNAYSVLPSYLESYVQEYRDDCRVLSTIETTNRLVSGTISITIFYIVIPLVSKNGTTIFHKVEKIGYVNKKEGYSVSKWKLVIKPLIMFILPVIGLIGFSKYSIITLIILPFFIDFLLIIFTNDHTSLSEKILKVECVDMENSLIFASEEEEKIYINAEIQDREYLDKLEKIASISDKAIDDKEKKGDR